MCKYCVCYMDTMSLLTIFSIHNSNNELVTFQDIKIVGSDLQDQTK